jgi:hypothetical protein
MKDSYEVIQHFSYVSLGASYVSIVFRGRRFVNRTLRLQAQG